MKIEAASLNMPLGLRELLIDLGVGENRFGSMPVHTGESTVEEYLHRCREMADPNKLRHGLVSQTVY